MSRLSRRFIKISIVIPLLMVALGSKNYWSASAQEKSNKKSPAIKKSISVRVPAVGASPESGVKLLIGILQRIGNVPALAMQQQSASNYAPPQPQAEAVSNQIFGQNLTDPALAIRPQMRRQSASQSQVSMGKAVSKAKPDNLLASAHKMYQLSKTIDELDRAANSYEQAPAPKGIVVSNSPRITEYGAATQTKNEAAAMKTIVGAIKEAQAEQMSRMSQDADDSAYSGGAGVGNSSGLTGAKLNRSKQIVKLDQPAYYKHIREYEEKRGSKDLADKFVAYNPPSMIFGIAGLQLGASNNEVSNYLKSQYGTDKSKFKSYKYKEWLVWSLVEPASGGSGEKTTLQIFSRANQVEALRIFDDKYIPEAVSVKLADTMAVMKNRFGEPAFVLEEPQPKDGGGDRKMIKNYVYPVSQVSFQLVRGESGTSPVVTSVLLFKFL